MKRIKPFVFLFLFLFFLNPKPSFSEIPDEKAVYCILGEARGEPWAGMVAVAEVLRRRGSTKGFVGCKAWGEPTANQRQKALRAWRQSRFTNYSRGADHFDGVLFKKPWWAKKMRKTVRIGNQQFWKA